MTDMWNIANDFHTYSIFGGISIMSFAQICGVYMHACMRTRMRIDMIYFLVGFFQASSNFIQFFSGLFKHFFSFYSCFFRVFVT